MKTTAQCQHKLVSLMFKLPAWGGAERTVSNMNCFMWTYYPSTQKQNIRVSKHPKQNIRERLTEYQFCVLTLRQEIAYSECPAKINLIFYSVWINSMFVLYVSTWIFTAMKDKMKEEKLMHYFLKYWQFRFQWVRSANHKSSPKRLKESRPKKLYKRLWI